MRAFSRIVCIAWLLTSWAANAVTPSPEAMAKLEALRKQSTRNGWTFTIAYSPVMEYPIENVTGLKVPEDWKKGATFVNPSITRVPTTWDWRDEAGGLTPIKNQKSCGSCWAFGTVAVFENLIKIRDNVVKNLSEQQLVSCNTDGWGCSGGYFAHDYHVKPGAALTADFPYTAQDSSCKSSLKYTGTIQSWAYVGGSENTYPTNDQIKQAIHDYGPVAVTVSATNSFQAYSGGIYNANDGGQTNHLVALVGYNDTSQYWILRNSWGASWGEQGYMRIKYKTNRVGEQTTFVNYKPACSPQPIPFTGADKKIKLGQSVFIGDMSIPGQTYQWTPEVSLDNPTVSSPLATPAQTTTYTLKVTNECGTGTKTVTGTVTSAKHASAK